MLGIEENTLARRRMQARLVRDAMSSDLVCVNDETTLDEVVALMDMRHVAQLPVVCGTTVVGIIGRVELLRAVAHALCRAKRGWIRNNRAEVSPGLSGRGLGRGIRSG